MHRLTLVGVVILLSACTQIATSEPTIASETVRTNWDLSYRSAGPPIAVELGDLQATEDGWAEQQVEIFGAQIEYVVDLQLADTYRPDGSEMVATQPEADAIVRLTYGDTETIRVNFPDELPPGTHAFALIIPVWINASEFIVDDPHDRIEVTLTYTVQSPEEQRAVAAFCEEAVPITDGRTPSLDELDELSRIAEAELDSDLYDALSEPLVVLIEDLDAYLFGAGDGYSIAEVNDVIGEICNVNMLSVSAMAD